MEGYLLYFWNTNCIQVGNDGGVLCWCVSYSLYMNIYTSANPTTLEIRGEEVDQQHSGALVLLTSGAIAHFAFAEESTAIALLDTSYFHCHRLLW